MTSLLGYVSSSSPIFATAFSIESSISSTAAGIAETVCAFAMLGDGFEATNDTPVWVPIMLVSAAGGSMTAWMNFSACSATA